MDELQATRSFAALSQETRLRIVRTLVKAGDEGVPAGVIADTVGVTASNVSFHLKELQRAGLVSMRREARSIIYAAAYSALGNLIRFLMQDCCDGHPEVCTPALAACCAPQPKRKKPVRA